MHAYTFLHYNRKAVLPIEAELCNSHVSDDEDVDEEIDVYTEQMHAFRDGIFQTAKGNITTAQLKMKRDYDKTNSRVKVINL